MSDEIVVSVQPNAVVVFRVGQLTKEVDLCHVIPPRQFRIDPVVLESFDRSCGEKMEIFRHSSRASLLKQSSGERHIVRSVGSGEVAKI